MTLCQLCQSISFDALPIFPKDDCYAIANDTSNRVLLFPKPRDPAHDAAAAAEETQRVKHHPDLESLRRAAAGGCEPCVLILGQADAMRAALHSRGEEGSAARRWFPAPSFDMWLTQRLGGGHGFWVMSGPEKGFSGPKGLLLIAAFGVVVEQDDPMAGVIHGRPVKAIADSEALQRVAQCLDNCDREHDGCHQPARVVPRRLLNLHTLQPDSKDSVQVVELGPDAHAEYAALSYASENGVARCWDKSMAATDCNSIPVAALPKIFQDSIFVARSLGLPYLWIDSLCIPGSLDEWQRSSPEAGSVYANAYVTISATGAADTSQGLFFPRAERQYARIPYAAQAGASSPVLAFCLPLQKEVQREGYIWMEDEPASAGVWNFQERVLSPRVVHFASDQLYVECVQEFVSEDGLRESICYHKTVAALPAETNKRQLSPPATDPFSRWYAILYDYGRRKMATPVDKLGALANVARAFGEMIPGDGGEYVAGHWKGSLPVSLFWQSLLCTPSGDGRAPSWSWASVQGIPAMSLGGAIVDQHYATVVATHVELANAADNNPFGAVRSASVTLEAPLIPLRLVEQDEMNDRDRHAGRVLLRGQGAEADIIPGLDTMEKRFSASADALRSMDLYALVLFRSHMEEKVCLGTCPIPQAVFHGLLVTSAADGGMRRLGFLLAMPGDLGPSFLLDNRETFKLV
ncbi:hypothetical protein PWT90_00390 [Aphanocladium album]|nr:hypothetical protein PWT90_00390 [Aphanocladium album]